jgi:hypothetical protein
MQSFFAHLRLNLEVLFDYCKKIGRNYDTILKTKLSHVIIAKDGEEAERRVNERLEKWIRNHDENS